jgi:type IV secretory pathway VirB10-like protein
MRQCMNDNSPESQLDLSPNPRITKINRSAFLIACSVIALIIAVLAYSVGQAGKANAKKSDVMPQITVDAGDRQLWYQSVSDELPITRNVSISSEPLESDENSNNKETLKKKDESLVAALESSIKASNIGNSISTLPPSPVISDNGLSTTINDSGSNPYSNQNDANMQSEKQTFLQKISQRSNPDYLHEIVKKPLSPYEVKVGSIIPAVLVGGINSDLPGQLTALVRQNVYDSVSGRYLLIPQGTKLILQYDSHVTYGQERLLVGVKRLIFPNGNSLDLDGMPASDVSGYAGFYDQVDNHYARIFGSSVMMGLITGGFELSQPSQGNNEINPSTSQVMGGALGQQMGQVTLGMMNKNLDIQPTLKIRPGYEFNVTITSDLVFPSSYRN